MDPISLLHDGLKAGGHSFWLVNVVVVFQKDNAAANIPNQCDGVSKFALMLILLCFASVEMVFLGAADASGTVVSL